MKTLNYSRISLLPTKLYKNRMVSSKVCNKW